MDQPYNFRSGCAVASDDAITGDWLQPAFANRTPNLEYVPDAYDPRTMNGLRLDTSVSSMQSLAAAQMNVTNFPAPMSISPDALQADPPIEE